VGPSGAERAAMDNSEQHIHSGFFAPMLDLAHERMGREKTEATLAAIGTSEAALRDPTAWVSSELAEAIVEALTRASGDPDLVVEAGSRAFTGPYLGIMKSLLQFGGSTRAMFGSFAKLSPRFNKAGTWSVLAIDDTMAELQYCSVHERSAAICRGRASQLSAAPVMFGLAPARVDHPACLHRGDSCCRYLIRWEEAPSDRGWLLGLGAGGAAFALLALGLGLGGVGVGLLSALGAAVGALVGHARRLDRQLERRGTQMLAQDRALERSMIASEARYAELLEAKQDVDRQVEARTHELRETSEQLGVALAEVRELDELKTRFFANVSHELRTPLQLILGSIEELGHDDVPPLVQRRLGVMGRNARRLHRLIDQVLDLAKADAGNAEAVRVPVRLSELVEGIVEAFDAMARGSGVRLVGEVGADVAAVVDPHWLESALTNLVANAIRHCAAGDGVTVRLQVDEEVVFEVEDTGPGIPADHLPRIFDRFVQSVPREGASRGTGLGLAIVREAARLHGGQASVRSTVGEGTIFTVRFPFEPADLAVAEVRVVAPDESHDQPEVTEHPGPHSEARLAVVAEDEPDLRAYVASTLAEHFRVIACAHGGLALEHIQRTLPDIVVSDRNMPVLSGIDLCRAVRDNPETARTPFILLTAHQTHEDVLSGYEAGVDDYVGKPFHPRELLARVHVQVRLRQLAREATVRERMASIGMLSAEIAHHFRNPLNFMRSGLTVVKKQLSPEWLTSKARFWDTLVESTERMELLTRDLLHLARGHEQATVQTMDPSESLRSAVRMIGATLPPDVRLEATTLEHATVRGRSGDLNQVVLNLLDNAGRAVGASGVLRVSARCEGEDYVICVEDSGPGIPESLQEHLFEAFVSSRAHGEGSGLGLAIAARVVAEHGGTIEAGRSESLGGAAFRIAIPLHREPSPLVPG